MLGYLSYLSHTLSHHSNLDLILAKGRVLGSVHRISSIISANKGTGLVVSQQQDECDLPNSTSDWEPPINLTATATALTVEQVEEVKSLLREENGVFSRQDDDIGCAEGLNSRLNSLTLHLFIALTWQYRNLYFRK